MTDQTHPDRQPPRAYSIKGFCEAYSLSRSTAFRLIKSGRLHSTTNMGRRVIPYDAAEALLQADA